MVGTEFEGRLSRFPLSVPDTSPYLVHMPDPIPVLIQRIRSAGLQVHEQVPLSECGTFRLGGPAKWVVECRTPTCLIRTRDLLKQAGVPALLLGEGSNVLFSDEGWPGVLVRYQDGDPEVTHTGSGRVRVSASANLDAVVSSCVGRGIGGLEAFSGIPGTVGGAVAGNAGAWGVQMEHVVHRVFGLDDLGNPRSWSREDCGFTYRDSRLKHDGSWVCDVELFVTQEDAAVLQAERLRILDMRSERHPHLDREPCIGSIFRNIEPTSAAERRQAAGWYLEQAGAKDMAEGGAKVFTKHANIIVNAGEACRADDVATLARRMADAVKSSFDLTLVREVRYLGPLAGETPGPGFY